jgi:hypothetical protein
MGQGQRECGGCRVCCKSPEIPLFGKPADTWCTHAIVGGGETGGCRIYSQRPHGCAEFRCGWLMGLGSEQDRPDKLGVMWQFTTDSSGARVVAFVEYRPGALESARVKDHLTLWRAPGRPPVFTRRVGEAQFKPVPLTIGGRGPRALSEPDPQNQPATSPR